MVEDLKEHANGYKRENQHLKAEIEDLHRKSKSLSENLASLKNENEKLSNEKMRLKTENADLIAENEELIRSKTDEEQAALTEMKGDLEIAKREKSSIQENLDIERIRKIYVHSCIGIYDGLMVMGGGNENAASKDIYLFRDSEWTVVGQLNEYHKYSSPKRIGNTIFLVSGYNVEKLEWDGEKISSAKVINITHIFGKFERPIVFPVDEFFCT
ncbi:Oidioi.mRNA.OKI2018_I69.PAR.g9576.t1.cds [Oikopleura dioica]|uniref:Oidioi.mRNA.OKI2018_I69.PAR.g9576.t1.cds n=1 Tax=Oikopleura dioica TaxID=34765 RepID=A0ABN7RLH1_OIKDI|nr:Oidioi.mRNA.OKI2018_I69.PAR.g9576.t1.cds [Oikopleura dioica]